MRIYYILIPNVYLSVMINYDIVDDIILYDSTDFPVPRRAAYRR